MTMLTNYVKIALRNLRRHMIYSVLNVTGLAVGIACCLLILLFVQHELSYDRHHTQADRIVRVAVTQRVGGTQVQTTATPIPLARTLTDAFPEVVQATRFGRMWEGVVSYQDHQYHESELFFADPQVFDIFDLNMIRGNPATALQAPNSIILTEDTARRYFGDEDPLGKVLTFTFEGVQEFEVTGLVEAQPSASHFHFDFLVPMASQPMFLDRLSDRWDFNFRPTYVLLTDAGAAASLEARLPDFVARHYPETLRAGTTLSLQPLTSIHLHSHLRDEIEPNGSPSMLYILGGIALAILLLACINFMNLATARSAERAREVGMRKVLGAERRHLIRQFLGEAVLLSVLATILALALVQGFLPLFNSLTGRSLEWSGAPTWPVPAALGALALIVGVVAGSYPAFVLSGFRPAQVLKGAFTGSRGGVALRRTLVIGQFVVTIFFLISIAVMYHQLHYLRTKDLGFAEEQILYIRSPQRTEPMNFAVYQRELERAPGVLHVAGAGALPGSGQRFGTVDARTPGMTAGEEVPTAFTYIHPAFIDTYGLRWTEGGDRLRDLPEGDSVAALVLNATAARALTADGSPSLGQHIDLFAGGEADPFMTGRVVGVVEDFHFESLHSPVQPLLLYVTPRAHTWTYLALRVRPDDLPETRAHIESTWQTLAPEWPLELSFLDEQFGALYAEEARLGRIVGTFTALAILVACLGLFGLATFTAEQRRKEIGIRKVLGASVPQIAFLLSKEFSRLVLAAFVLAVPVAYVVMHRWLDGFAHRVGLAWWIFLAAGLAALGIALLTVGYQAVKAALSDPVKALRYE